MIQRAIRGRGTNLVLLLLVLSLAWFLLPMTQRATGTRAATPRVRWLGPVASLAHDIQWIRYQRALLAGDHQAALAHAESALAFDPGSTEGWLLIASHFAFFRASPEREEDLERRRAWFRAGVNATRRGARVARDPGELHFLRGLMYLSKMEVDPVLLPGGESALRTAAVSALEDAERAGHSAASTLLESLGSD